MCIRDRPNSIYILSAIAFANRGGTAFPICSLTCTFDPKKINLSSKDCNLAASLGVIALFKNG